MMNQLRSEWIKLRTVRSTWVLLFVSIALTVVISGLVGFFRRNKGLEAGSVAQPLLAAFIFSMFIIGVSAVLLVSSEFRTGTIRATLAAQPSRARLFAAKAIVVAVVAFVVGTVMCVLALAVGRGTLAIGTAEISFNGTDYATVAGAVAFFVLFALWGVGIAFLIRHSAGAICALLLWPLVGEGILVPIITNLLNKRWISRYMPYTAGFHLFAGRNEELWHSRLAGGAYFAAIVALFLGLGFWMFRRRDA
jgi:ABC-2 type transport system permease protein